MSDGEIKVRYGDIETALAEIMAIKEMVSDTKSLDLGMAQSRGPATDGLNEAARAIETATELFEGLCQRCYDIVQRASDTYAATDATAAGNIETTGR